MHEFWSGLLTIQSSSALTSTLVLSAPPTPPDATSTSTSISAATLPAVLPRILGHLNDCADCASVYQTDVLASIDSSGPGLVEVTFTRGGGGAEEEDDDWGDGFELSGALAGLAFEDDDEDGEASASANHDATIAAAYTIPPLPDSISASRSWVSAMMSTLGICPFTNGEALAGLPMGKVRYEASSCKLPEEAWRDFWYEVIVLQEADPKEVSTTLLVCPEFCVGEIEGYLSFTQTLAGTLELLKMEDLMQLVFFHPLWSFRDGADRASSAGNFARRSPYPMLNLLRTDQVRRAQKGIPTGLVYKQNDAILGEIGEAALTEMMVSGSWEAGVEGHEVDRSEYEALAAARRMQKGESSGVEGGVGDDVKKRGGGEGEIGDLVGVILEGMEARLGGGKLGVSEGAAVVTAINALLGRL